MISVKSAPRWISIAAVFLNAMFMIPVLMLFYGGKGVTVGDFFLIQGISWIFVFLIEIPTGYIGDLFSRKNTIIAGLCFWILGYLTLIFGYNFWIILTGELEFAVAISLISGTVDAYLYDILKKSNKEKNYHKRVSKMKTIENIGLMVATFTGAFLYEKISPNAPVWLSVFCVCVSIGIYALLPDVPESKRIVAKDKSKWQDILDISKYAIKNKEIKWLMIFPSVYGMLTLILMWGLQSVMINRSIPVFMFSFIVGLNALTRLIYSSLSGKILEKCNISGVVQILSGIILVATIAACSSIYIPFVGVYPCLFLMILGSGSVVLAQITTTILVNHRIKSDERATVLSVKSMFQRALQGVGMIALKPLFDNIGVGQTFMVSALLLIPILICAQHLCKMKLKTMKEV